MKAKLQVLVLLQMCDVFFVELKAEGIRRNAVFLSALEAKPTGLTSDRQRIYCI